MQKIDQLQPLTAAEARNISGGLLGNILGGLFSGSAVTTTPGGGSSVDYTAYMTGMSAAYAAMSSGMGMYYAQSGVGMAMFLSNIRYPVQ